MNVAIPFVGVVIIILLIIVLCFILFPSLPFFYDKTKEHFDLKDEDYEEETKNNES